MQPEDRSVSSLDTDLLRETLRPFPIRLAVLFGSRASDTAHRFSDLDVAIEFEKEVSDARKRELLDEMTATLVRETGHEAVDLVDLDGVDPEIGYSALDDGVLLLGDETEAAELQSELLLRKLDFDPIKRMWRRGLDRRLREGTYGRSG